MTDNFEPAAPAQPLQLTFDESVDEVGSTEASQAALDEEYQRAEKLTDRFSSLQAILAFLSAGVAVAATANSIPDLRFWWEDRVGARFDPLSLVLPMTAIAAVAVSLVLLQEFGRRGRASEIISATRQGRDKQNRSAKDMKPGRPSRQPNPPQGWSHFGFIANDMRRRLSDEIDALGLRASINVAMGVVFAFAGVGVLFWLSLSTNLPAHSTGRLIHVDSTVFWGNFIARIGLSITLSVMAFFFFATYRRSLLDIKYFQNELTTLESKIVALFWSDQKRTPSEIDHVIQAWLNNERNVILRAGESTADISSMIVDSKEIVGLAALLTENLKASKEK